MSTPQSENNWLAPQKSEDVEQLVAMLKGFIDGKATGSNYYRQILEAIFKATSVFSFALDRKSVSITTKSGEFTNLDTLAQVMIDYHMHKFYNETEATRKSAFSHLHVRYRSVELIINLRLFGIADMDSYQDTKKFGNAVDIEFEKQAVVTGLNNRAVETQNLRISAAVGKNAHEFIDSLVVASPGFKEFSMESFLNRCILIEKDNKHSPFKLPANPLIQANINYPQIYLQLKTALQIALCETLKYRFESNITQPWQKELVKFITGLTVQELNSNIKAYIQNCFLNLPRFSPLSPGGVIKVEQLDLTKSEVVSGILDENQTLKDEIGRLNRIISDNKSEIEDLKITITESTEQIEELEQRNADEKVNYHKYEKQIMKDKQKYDAMATPFQLELSQSKREIEILTEKLDALKAEYDKTFAELQSGKKAFDLYKTQQLPLIFELSNTKKDLERYKETLGINRTRNEELQSKVDELNLIKTPFEESKTALKSSYEQNKANMEKISLMQGAITQLENQNKTNQETIEEKEKIEKRLGQLLLILNEQLKNSKPIEKTDLVSPPLSSQKAIPFQKNETEEEKKKKKQNVKIAKSILIVSGM